MGNSLKARFSLKSLSLEACSQMLSGYLGGKTLEKKHADKLIEQSKGNPFALGEYLRAWMDQGVLIPGESEWKVDQARLEKLALPTDVIELLVKRISELSQDSLSCFPTSSHHWL